MRIKATLNLPTPEPYDGPKPYPFAYEQTGIPQWVKGFEDGATVYVTGDSVPGRKYIVTERGYAFTVPEAWITLAKCANCGTDEDFINHLWKQPDGSFFCDNCMMALAHALDFPQHCDKIMTYEGRESIDDIDNDELILVDVYKCECGRRERVPIIEETYYPPRTI